MPVLLPGQPISSRRSVLQPIVAGGGAWTPATPTGLVAWYKADAGTSTTVDGDPISQWDDQSGNARHLTQATGSKQPLYKASTINSMPGVRTDGVDDFLNHTAGAAFVTGTTLTVAMVYRRVAASANFARALALFRSAGGNDYNHAGSMALNQSLQDREAVDRAAALTRQGPGHPGNGVAMLTLLWWDGTNANQRYNSAAATIASAASTGTWDVTRIVLGAGDSAAAIGAFGNYDFCELMIWDNDIGSTHRTNLETYTDRWGL